jgi:uncharacterized membrane protein
MSTLIGVLFEDETTAFEMRVALLKMQKEYLIDLEDAVVVTRDAKGRIKLDQVTSLTTAGALGGGFWGMLLGLIFLNPFIGAAIGAAAGSVMARFSDIGLNDQVMKDMAQSFKPGSSALFILLRRVTADKVLERLKAFAGKGKVFQSSLSKDEESTLQQALDAAA